MEADNRSMQDAGQPSSLLEATENRGESRMGKHRRLDPKAIHHETDLASLGMDALAQCRDSGGCARRIRKRRKDINEKEDRRTDSGLPVSFPKPRSFRYVVFSISRTFGANMFLDCSLRRWVRLLSF